MATWNLVSSDVPHKARGALLLPGTVTEQTGAYSALVSDVVLADASAGGFTVTLPEAPDADSMVVVRKTDVSSEVVTVQRSGTDLFNASDGPSSVPLTMAGQTLVVQYKNALWHVVSNTAPTSSLDGRYRNQSAVYDTNGNTAVQVSATSNAVNYLRVVNAAASGHVNVRAAGADSNIGLILRSKGTESIYLDDDDQNIMAYFSPVTSQVNYWRFRPSATGNAITAEAKGSDTNVDIDLIPKGAGQVTQDGLPMAVKTSSPAGPTASGTPGMYAATSSYLYVCTATDTWRRVAVETW